jgi:hypothetical protein
MQAFKFGSLYLQGDELKKRRGTLDQLETRPDRPGTASTTTSTSAIKPAGKNGGEKWIRTDMATTTTQALTI